MLHIVIYYLLKHFVNDWYRISYDAAIGYKRVALRGPDGVAYRGFSQRKRDSKQEELPQTAETFWSICVSCELFQELSSLQIQHFLFMHSEPLPGFMIFRGSLQIMLRDFWKFP